jgi:DNA end-binding protein Ku
MPGYGAIRDIKLRLPGIRLAEQLASSLAEAFHIERYHDEFQERLRTLIEAKQKGKEIAAEPHAQHGQMIDRMIALKKSLETSTQAKRASHATSVSSHRRVAHRAAS